MEYNNTQYSLYQENSDTPTIIFMILILFAIYMSMICEERHEYGRY